MTTCDTPDWAWALICLGCCVWVGLCIHAAHMSRDSAFWAGFIDGASLRFIWGRRQIEREKHERVKRMLDRLVVKSTP